MSSKRLRSKRLRSKRHGSKRLRSKRHGSKRHGSHKKYVGGGGVNVNELTKLTASELWDEITRLNQTNDTHTNKDDVNSFIINFNASYANDLGGSIPLLTK